MNDFDQCRGIPDSEAAHREGMGWAIGLARGFRDQVLRLMGGEKGLKPEANEALQ